MFHQRKIALATLIFAAAMSGACDGHNPASPVGNSQSSALAKTTGGSATSGTPTTPSSDTSYVPSYSGTVVIRGQAVMLRIAPARGTSDTLTYQPVPGVAISLLANATGQLVATAVTPSDGSFSFTVPAGAYRIVGHPAVGSGASDGSVLVSATGGTIYTQLILPSTP